MIERIDTTALPLILRIGEFPAQERDLAEKEAIAFQKKWDWEARQRMVVREVLNASDATEKENFF